MQKAEHLEKGKLAPGPERKPARPLQVRGRRACWCLPRSFHVLSLLAHRVQKA